MAKLYFPYTQSSNKQIPEQVNSQKADPVQYHLDSLRDASIKFLYQLRLAAKLATIQDGTANGMYEDLKKVIHEAAREALGEKPASRNNDTQASWWTEDLQRFTEEKKKYYRKWLTTQQDEDRENYKTMRRKVQIEVNKAKNEHWETICREVNNCTGNTRVNKSWKILKGLRTQHKDKAGMNLINLKEWTTYYKTLLTEDRSEFLSDDMDDSLNSDETVPMHLPQVTSEEIKIALTQMKDKKAPEIRCLYTELLKSAPNELLDVLASIFNKCLQGSNPSAD